MSSRPSGQGATNRVDEHLRALSHRYRRFVLAYLRSSETPVALADLTDALVRWETEQPPTAVPTARSRIDAALYHAHLPHLADARLATFDSDANLVSRGPDADAVAPFLERLPGDLPSESGEDD